MNPNLSFREDVVAADAARVREIVTSSGFFHDHEIDVAVELVEERLARGEKSGYYFLFAEIDGVAAAYCCFGPIACTVGSFDLYWIAVHQDYRGRGVGGELLRRSEAVMARMHGRGIYVETSSQEKYHPTRTFYEHNGYRVAAVLPDFYAPQDDKVIYVKRIP